MTQAHHVHSSSRPVERIIGSSPVMQGVLAQVRAVAPRPVNVVLTGPTGCGKEALGRYIHQLSGRSPLVIINCGALQPELSGSELFGHLRGSFTGAENSKRGLLEAASGGTIFLDEVGELPLSVQASLLRATQQGDIRPLGGTRERHLDLRYVCATNRDLPAMVRKGTFREDLYWRLAQYEIDVPGLQARGTDILEIAQHILATDPLFQGQPYRLEPSARRELLAHTWPGNVRELRRALARAAIQGACPLLTGDDIRRAIEGGAPPTPVASSQGERILHCLGHFGILSAASLCRQLGVGRATFLRWVEPLLETGEVRRLSDGRGTEYELRAGSASDVGMGQAGLLTGSTEPVHGEVIEVTARGLEEDISEVCPELHAELTGRQGMGGRGIRRRG